MSKVYLKKETQGQPHVELPDSNDLCDTLKIQEIWHEEDYLII